MEMAGACIVAEAAAFTEGDPARRSQAIALGHLSRFKG